MVPTDLVGGIFLCNRMGLSPLNQVQGLTGHQTLIMNGGSRGVAAEVSGAACIIIISATFHYLQSGSMEVQSLRQEVSD